jgi:hypothetical protein
MNDRDIAATAESPTREGRPGTARAPETLCVQEAIFLLLASCTQQGRRAGPKPTGIPVDGSTYGGPPATR